VTPRKSALISLSLNCGSQRLNDIVITKYERATAYLGLAGKADGRKSSDFSTPGTTTSDASLKVQAVATVCAAARHPRSKNSGVGGTA